MEFKKAFISELKPAKYNPRKDLTDQDPEYLRIKRSIEEFGYVDPVIVNADYTVIGGHQRIKVLRDLGHASIDVVVVDIPKIKEKALNIALNKITGEWDTQRLTDLLGELKTGGFDISITGFDEKEFDGLLRELHKDDEPLDSEPQISRAEELRKEWGTELGQMWQCGDHFVICGDCTDPAVVGMVMQGDKADMVFTSPPYNANMRMVHYEGKKAVATPFYRDNESDNKENKEYVSFLNTVLGTCLSLTDGFVFWNISYNANSRYEWIENTFEYRKQLQEVIVWKKSCAMPVKHGFTRSYEFIFVYSTKGKYEHLNGVDETISNFWEIKNSGCSTDEHKACFPIELPQKAISISDKIRVVFDPFLGSGTTMIACENLGRKARGCEIDPGYVAVILQRYKDTFPGKEIRLIADNAGA